jgi:hypothetical protein
MLLCATISASFSEFPEKMSKHKELLWKEIIYLVKTV